MLRGEKDDIRIRGHQGGRAVGSFQTPLALNERL